jgi:hypothetical protein
MPRTSGEPGLGPPTAAQIEALFTAANQIFKGTGSHTGALQDFGTVLGSQFSAKGSLEAGTGAGTAAQLAVGSNTQVLTADSTQTTGLKWAAAAGGSLTSASGVLANPVTLTNGGTTQGFDTLSLAAGTWLVTAGGSVQGGNDPGALEVELVVDTATATFSGQAAAIVDLAVGSARGGFSLTAIVTVTIAGTLQVELNNQTGTDCTLLVATPNGTFPGATGWTALKIG